MELSSSCRAKCAADILAGKEVIVPIMVGDRDGELRKRTGTIARMRISLKLKDYNFARDIVKGTTQPATRPATSAPAQKG